MRIYSKVRKRDNKFIEYAKESMSASVENPKMKSRLLITGINGFICEDCAKQAYEIIQSTGVLAPKAGGR